MNKLSRKVLFVDTVMKFCIWEDKEGVWYYADAQSCKERSGC